MPPHIRPPERVGPCNGLTDDAHWIRVVDRNPAQSAQDASNHSAIGQPDQEREQIAKYVAFVAPEGEVDEAQVQLAIAGPVSNIVRQQARSAILNYLARERKEQMIEVVAR